MLKLFYVHHRKTFLIMNMLDQQKQSIRKQTKTQLIHHGVWLIVLMSLSAQWLL